MSTTPSALELSTADNITERVTATFAACPDERLREILECFVRHLHAFARDSNLSRTEWAYAVDYILRAGLISDETRNEFMALSDTLGLTTLVELMASDKRGGTPLNLLGPFYVEDAPELEFNADLRRSFPGEPCLLRGRVLDLESKPIAGARINVWQTQEDGLYDVQIPGCEPRFRGWMTTGADGTFQVRTIKPVGYTAPMDGPLGEMLRATKRNEWRPAHWHFLIRADGFAELITELYPSDSPHLHDDVGFGPRDALVVEPLRIVNEERARSLGLSNPFVEVTYDFQLPRS